MWFVREFLVHRVFLSSSSSSHSSRVNPESCAQEVPLPCGVCTLHTHTNTKINLHRICQIVDHFTHPRLHNFHRAPQARTSGSTSVSRHAAATKHAWPIFSVYEQDSSSSSPPSRPSRQRSSSSRQDASLLANPLRACQVCAANVRTWSLSHVTLHLELAVHPRLFFRRSLLKADHQSLAGLLESGAGTPLRRCSNMARYL